MSKMLLMFLLIGSLSALASGRQSQPTSDEKSSSTDTTAMKKKTGLANPASVNCEKKGGKLEIRKGRKGEYGVCKFSNGKECEEWALFRGKCSPDAEKPEPQKSPGTEPPAK